jgi:hypothetical protein
MGTETMPEEILCAIMGHLPFGWLRVASFACSRWHQCATTVAAAAVRRLAPGGAHAVVERPLTEALLYDAIASDGLPAFRWLHAEVGLPWSTRTFNAAALAGRVPFVEEMLTHQPAGWLGHNCAPCLVAALVGCGLALAKRVHDQGHAWSAHVLHAAVAMGDANDVARLVAWSCPRDYISVMMALAMGRDDLVAALAVSDAVIERARRKLDDYDNYGFNLAFAYDADHVIDTVQKGGRGRALAIDLFLRLSYCFAATGQKRTQDSVRVAVCTRSVAPERRRAMACAGLTESGGRLTLGLLHGSLTESPEKVRVMEIPHDLPVCAIDATTSKHVPSTGATRSNNKLL